MTPKISLEEIQSEVKEWADDYDKQNVRAPQEVWAKIDKYGWLATLSYRAGLTELEDVLKHVDGGLEVLDGQKGGVEQILESIDSENVTTLESVLDENVHISESVVTEDVQTPDTKSTVELDDTESLLTSDLKEDISERTSEIIILNNDGLSAPNIRIVDDSSRIPDEVLLDDVS